MSWNEAQANADMEAQAEHDRLHARQNAARLSNEAARERKHDNNMRFWHSIKQVAFVIVCAAIAVYTLIHFA